MKWTVLSVLLAVGPTAAPAFAREGAQADCTKAQSAVEKLICADNQLRELDEHLGRYYAAARSSLGTGGACLQTDQAAWLKSPRGACRDAACLKAAYVNRLAELDPLQPGATAIKNIDLPPVPALMWVIGPAADTVAAPPNPTAAAFEASGRIVNDVADGDGFMLQTSDGAKLPLAMLMFLDGETSDRLAVLARTSATYRVRGFVAADGDRRFFEPSRCAFIHRIDATDVQDLERVRTRIVTQGSVCPDPNRPCPGFKANELSFAIAQPFKFDRGRDRSQPFYAVILKSGPLCGIDDGERVTAQQQFPAAKVFIHRHMCEDFGDKVTYSGVDAKSGFLAVYGGVTEAEARQLLAQAKKAGYPDANLRRMEAIVVYQVE